MSPNDSNDSRTLAWSWGALSTIMAGWECFLRADSLVLSTATKLWLFPLLLMTFFTLGASVGFVVTSLLRRLAGWSRMIVLALPFYSFAALLVGAEYAGLARNHMPEHNRLWVFAALVGVALAWLLLRLIRGLTGGLERRGLRLHLAARPIALLCAVALAATVAASVRRPDVVSSLLRSNTVLGQLAGRALARFKPELETPRNVIVRPRDLPASRTLGSTHVILVSVDTLRADFVSTYGAPAASTPALEALAAESVVFEDAFVQRPKSSPSMASLLSGLYPAQHGTRENAMPLADEVETIAETFARKGFATAGFVTNINFDDDFNFQQGFESYAYLESRRDELGLILDTTDPEAVDAGLAWAAANSGRRMLLWVHLNAPHSPYLPPLDLRPILSPGAGDWFNVLNMPAHLARVEGLRTYFDRDVYLKLYAAEVASVDRQVGRLMRGLRDLGVLDDAQVLFLADHGEAFGEADAYGHGGSLHPAETHVPLLWRLPRGERAGARIRTTVQLVDVVPTLRALAGLDPMRGLEGRNLAGLLLGEAAEDDGFALSEAGYRGKLGVRGMRYAARTRTRALWLHAGIPHLVEFNRSADPRENNQLRYQRRENDPLLDALAAFAQRAEGGARRRSSSVHLDENQKDRLRALGYL